MAKDIVKKIDMEARPEPRSVVWCCMPYDEDVRQPGPKMRPVIILNYAYGTAQADPAVDDLSLTDNVLVVPCTSAAKPFKYALMMSLHNKQSWSLVPTPIDLRNKHANLSRITLLPIREDFFPRGLTARATIKSRHFLQLKERIHRHALCFEPRPALSAAKMECFYRSRIGHYVSCGVPFVGDNGYVGAHPAAPALIMGDHTDFGPSAPCIVVMAEQKIPGGLEYTINTAGFVQGDTRGYTDRSLNLTELYALPFSSRFFPGFFSSLGKLDSKIFTCVLETVRQAPLMPDRRALSQNFGQPELNTPAP